MELCSVEYYHSVIKLSDSSYSNEGNNTHILRGSNKLTKNSCCMEAVTCIEHMNMLHCVLNTVTSLPSWPINTIMSGYGLEVM